MFVSKKFHQAEIARLKENHESVIQGLTYYLKSKDDQIEDLRSLVFPKSSAKDIPEEAREADSVLSASEKPSTMSEEERSAILAGEREMNLLISDNYDQDLLQ